MSITVLDPSPLTTVQDAGRVGYAAQGCRCCAPCPAHRTPPLPCRAGRILSTVSIP